MTTIEDAQKCPKCGHSGEATSKHSGPRRSTVHNFTCRNTLCPWFETSWIVQVKEDGTIPERAAGEREFAKLPEFDSTKERVDEMLRRQVEQETQGR